MRSLKNVDGVMDITVAISIGVVFAALMVVTYIIYTLRASLIKPGTGVTPASLNNSIANITGGFDSSVKILIVAVMVAILALALSYLMMLRSG